MVASQLHLTHVSRLTECLKTTPMLAGLVGDAHHSAHTVRHVPTSADSAVELKVAPHQLDIVIGQVYHTKSLGTLMQTELDLQLSRSLLRREHETLMKRPSARHHERKSNRSARNGTQSIFFLAKPRAAHYFSHCMSFA